MSAFLFELVERAFEWLCVTVIVSAAAEWCVINEWIDEEGGQ